MKEINCEILKVIFIIFGFYKVNLGEVHNKETIIQAVLGNVALKLVVIFLFAIEFFSIIV